MADIGEMRQRLATRFFDFAGNQLPHVFQVHMAGHELREAVGNGDDRLAEVRILHAQIGRASCRERV